MVIKLGGKRFAIIISSVAVIFAPIYLAMFAYYSMNSFDILLWTIALYLIILIVIENKLSHWMILGFVMGLGLLNKIGFLWLGFGFFAGLLLTDKRRDLLSPKPYLTALIALIIFTPYIIWNFQNNFAHIEFINNATSGKYSQIGPGDFILGQFLIGNPWSAIIWLIGLYYFLFNGNGKKFRLLAIIYLASFTILLVNGHSKPEYLAPAYTMLFAGGGVFLEKLTTVKLRWLRYVIIIPLLISGIVFSPLAIPVLPVEQYINYANSLGFGPSTSEDKELAELPQFYADMFGWEEMAANVSTVYLSLPDEQKDKAFVFGRNYGEASSIEFYKKKYPLPDAVSGHNTFWLWGPKNVSDPVIIITGGNKDNLLKLFDTVEEAMIHTAKYSMPYENNIPIYIARNPKKSLGNNWEEFKHYD